MASVPVDLPDNLAACHVVIRRQAEALDEQAARIEELLGHIDRLSRDLAAVKRQLFGSRRERFVSSGGESGVAEEVVIEEGEGTRPRRSRPWPSWASAPWRPRHDGHPRGGRNG